MTQFHGKMVMKFPIYNIMVDARLWPSLALADLIKHIKATSKLEEREILTMRVHVGIYACVTTPRSYHMKISIHRSNSRTAVTLIMPCVCHLAIMWAEGHNHAAVECEFF